MVRGRDQVTTVSDLVEKWVPVCAVHVALFSELLYPVALRNTDLRSWFLTSDLRKKTTFVGLSHFEDSVNARLEFLPLLFYCSLDP